MRHDRTMSDTSAFASDPACAAILGRSVAWFRTHRPRLEREGFPRRDPLIGLTLRADIQAWLSKRATVAHHAKAPESPPQENLDAF